MKPWIGVDLDGTLAESTRGEFIPGRIGNPIASMLAQVKHMLALGDTVKIFTARVASTSGHVELERAAIREWTRKHLGRELEATAEKDLGMRHLYDDRAVPMRRNTGEILDDHAVKRAAVVQEKKRPEPLPETAGGVARQVAAIVEMDYEVFKGLDFGYRKALEFYAAHKADMDAGIDMLEPKQLPAHRFYWFFAHKGEAWIASELQNDPQSNPNIRDLQLIEHALLARRVEWAERIVPEWARYVTVTIDLGLYRLHWQADAWSADGTTSHLIECGIEETHIDERGAWQAMTDPTGKQMMSDEAIKRALERLQLRFAKGFKRAIAPGVELQSAEIVLPALHGIDCGGVAGASVRHAWDKVVFAFCARAGAKWLPLKGESPWTETISDRAGSQPFICEEKNNPGKRIDCHVDLYKKRAYDAYQLPTRDARGLPIRGTRTLHMDTADRSLAPYCKHQTSEKHVERFTPGRDVNKSMRIGWEPADKRKPVNHWWDTCWMAFAVIDILLFKLGTRRPPMAIPKERRENPNAAFS